MAARDRLTQDSDRKPHAARDDARRIGGRIGEDLAGTRPGPSHVVKGLSTGRDIDRDKSGALVLR